jgi:hypothetical protein
MARPDENQHIYSVTDPTGTTYSDVFSLSRGSMFSLHIDNAGVTGTLTLWVSNNPDYDAAVAEWIEETGVTFTALAGASVEFLNAGNAAGRFYKVRYAHSSGTGALNIYANYGEA